MADETETNFVSENEKRAMFQKPLEERMILKSRQYRFRTRTQDDQPWEAITLVLRESGTSGDQT